MEHSHPYLTQHLRRRRFDVVLRGAALEPVATYPELAESKIAMTRSGTVTRVTFSLSRALR